MASSSPSGQQPPPFNPHSYEVAGEIALPANLLHNAMNMRLFVGSLGAAEDASFLRHYNVTHVLSMAGGKLQVTIGGAGGNDESGDDYMKEFGSVKHRTIDIADHPSANILAVLDDAMTFLDDAFATQAGGDCSCFTDGSASGDRLVVARESKAVLVHCASGVSRSVTTVIAWLMTRAPCNLEKALEIVKNGRPCGNPNLGFRYQLSLLEKELARQKDEKVGVVERACKLWTKNARHDMMTEAQRQREVVNELHARVDEIEVDVATLLSSSHGMDDGEISGNMKVKLKQQLREKLEVLQTQADGCLPTEDEGYVDRPARIILKSVAGKAERLLVSLMA